MPAFLSDHEFVMNAGAVDHYGLDFMNAVSTKPTIDARPAVCWPIAAPAFGHKRTATFLFRGNAPSPIRRKSPDFSPPVSPAGGLFLGWSRERLAALGAQSASR
jgi:hypothetical protein